jgi:hypothetical protein
MSGFRNYASVRRQIERIPRAYMRELARAGMAEMGVELKEVNRLTPVLTGALRSTEHLEGPIWIGETKVKILIVVGGEGAPYAFYVHEDLEAFHRVGQAKFIEQPLRESAPYLPSRIAKRIDMNRVRQSLKE